MEHKQVIVGSKNPVKEDATRQGLERIAPHIQWKISSCITESGVSLQPRDDEETYTGARNRAQNASVKNKDASYYVGIEGGVEKRHQHMEVFAWIVILDNKGREGRARTSSFILPAPLQVMVEQDIELGEATDIFFGESNSKQKGGVIGSLSNGIIGRREYYVQPIMLAFFPFLQEDFYFPHEADTKQIQR